MYKDINNIRQGFLNFFKNKNHQIVSGSSLVPDNDKTLLFTNSGMNQFKKIFLGIDKPLFKRVATVQRCMRAGGKHNDLNNVGYTDRHLTFFEMLGNFSFGDYFKRDAIQFSWELLTDINWFNLPAEKLWVTVHASDSESYNIWIKDIGISSKRVIRVGSNKNNFCDSDNFWQMGNIGPCGPCSEIFYDRGSDFKGHISEGVQIHGERYIEIWNLVFIQFNLQESGDLLPLPMLSVDTGMGLERITSVLQGVHSNYAVDVFRRLIISVSQILNVSAVINERALYVIVDHIRASVMLIRDGVIPSNEGRGYVLRRIIRRAIIHGKKIGVSDIFFCRLVVPLVKSMNYIADILYDKKDYIEEILFNEEKLFENTLKKGLILLNKQLKKLSGNVLNGEIVFYLYSTYGLPFEVTQDICNLHDIKIDQASFDQSVIKHKERAKSLNKSDIIINDQAFFDKSSIFIGYQLLISESKIISLFQSGKLVTMLSAGMDGVVILNYTPFYGESGGQIGDFGKIYTNQGLFEVLNTKKFGKMIRHIGRMVVGILCVEDRVTAAVDLCRRQNICMNHSVTHLLRAALFKILGDHVIQRGSFINHTILRFDFSHHAAMTVEQVDAVENLINKKIWKNLCIKDEILSLDIAKKNNVIMLPNKQYTDTVRVVHIGNFSSELCGGTHVARTGEIGLFFVTKECSVSAGVRRIEGVTGEIALSAIKKQKVLIHDIARLIRSDNDNLLNKIHTLKLNFKKIEKEMVYLKHVQVMQKSISFMKDIFYIKDISVIIKQVDNLEFKILSDILDNLKNQLKLGVIVLINVCKNDKIFLMIGVTKNLVQCNRIDAVDLLSYIVKNLGGKKWGRSDFAQANIIKVVTISKLMNIIHSLLYKVILRSCEITSGNI